MKYEKLHHHHQIQKKPPFVRLIVTKPMCIFNCLLFFTFLFMLYLLSNQYRIYHENQMLMQPKVNENGNIFEGQALAYYNRKFVRNNKITNVSNTNNINYSKSEIYNDRKVEEILAYLSSSSSSSSTPARSPSEHEDSKNSWYNLFQDSVKTFYEIFTLNNDKRLEELRTWAIDKQRNFLKTELGGYELCDKKKKYGDLIMEKGGSPIRNAIFTTWRSGSTFVAEVIEAIPGTMYHYEPLLHFDIVRVRSGALAKEGTRVIRDLFNCDYSNLSDYVNYGKDHHWLLNHNSRIWQYCEENHAICLDSSFLSTMCKMFPFQILKTVRMRLKLAKSFLDDPKLNLKLLLLVRDPRGTLQSRRHREWCPGNPDCDSPAALCSDLEDDYKTARRFRKLYPDRFLTLRYEDISLNPFSAIKKLFNFFELKYDSRIDTYLTNHTAEDVGGVSSTFRDSKNAPFHWRQDLASEFDQIQGIQTICSRAMKLWGYKSARDPEHLLQFFPLDNAPWAEMIIPQDKLTNNSNS